MSVRARLELGIAGCRITDDEFPTRWHDLAQALERGGQTSATAVYHLTGCLQISGDQGAVEIEDDIYGPILRLGLESVPLLAAGGSYETEFEASVDTIQVEPAEGALVVTVSEQDPVPFPAVALLEELVRVGTSYLHLLRDLSTRVPIAPEFVADLEAAVGPAEAAVDAARSGWPVADGSSATFDHDD